VFDYAYRVTDPSGDTDEAKVVITIENCPDLVPVANDDAFAGDLGVPLSFDICANDVASEGFQSKSRVSGNYAPGLTRSGCIISGTATACGVYNYTYRVTDASGDTDEANVVISIENCENLVPVANDDEFSGELGSFVPLSFDICANDVASEGFQTKTRVSGFYPPGLTRKGCIISGTATACGVYNYTYRVTDPQGDSDDADVVITIDC